MEDASGMQAFVSSLGQQVSAANLWGVVGNAVVIIGTSVLFGLGIRIITRVVRRITKGRGGM